ncbi:MAG: DUF4112 domain-containing protein [candidate division Zixibacteria bacterium]|nr:DUF4112 domain-containing protein [candidate division Zixibacteria bacterium]
MSSPEPISPQIERIRWLARILDDWIVVPGTRYRIGLDALIGLVPGYGDVLGLLLAGVVVIEAARVGAPPRLLFRMALNVAVEVLIGAVPGVGDLFDFVWKANARNLVLLRRHLGDTPLAPRKLRFRTLVVAGALLAGLIALAESVAYLAWLAIGWLVDLTIK